MPASSEDLRFDRELQKFRDATRGLIDPQPGKAHGLIPITRGTPPSPGQVARGEPVGGPPPIGADRQPSESVT